MNPFVELLNWLSDGPSLSVSCGCTDDIGSALKAMLHLKVQSKISSLLARASGVHLKPSKCFLIVSVVHLTEGIATQIKGWLQTHIPEWADFQIVDCRKYLGVWLGCNGADQTWPPSPSHKYLERSISISAANAPALNNSARS